MEIKEIEQCMNDYIVAIGADNNCIFANLPFFYRLSVKLEKTLEKYFQNYRHDVKFEELSIMPLFDKIELVKQFYNDAGIEFDIDKAISDGTIDFEIYDLFYDNEDIESYKLYKYSHGINCYEGEKKIVNTCNNGFVTDILVFVHELSHFRDQPDIKRNQVSDLFTETLAITEELICADYLSKRGYKEEVKKFILDYLYMLYGCVSYMRPIYKMFLLFEDLGSISKENYKYYYEDDQEYENDYKKIENFANEQIFIKNSWYVLGTILAPYLYLKYKNDNSFVKSIIKLHDMINTKLESECFKEMGLTDLNPNELDVLLENIDNIMTGKVKTL